MRIRMLVEMSGSRNGQPWPERGTVAELPTAEAAHLVASGVAEEVTGYDAVSGADRRRRQRKSHDSSEE